MEAALKGAGEIGFTIGLHHLVADRRVHPALSDGRLCREVVPRVRRYGERLAGALAGDLIEPYADAMLAAAEIRGRQEHGRLFLWFESMFDGLLGFYERGLKSRPAAPIYDLDGHVRHDRSHRLPLLHHPQRLLSGTGHGI